jgi:hypothetical protein
MHRWLQLVLVVGCCVALPLSGFAQDTDDEFIFEDEKPPAEEDEEEALPEEEDDTPPAGEKKAPVEEEAEGDTDDPLEFTEDDALEFEADPEEEEVDIFDGESTEEEVLAEGVDNARLYRKQQEAMEDLDPDEEIMAWEEYLTQYPASIFRERIQTRIDELEDASYRATLSSGRGTADAKDAELLFVSPLHLPNVNPRTRVQVGLDFGFGTPVYVRGTADVEYAVLRNLSVHGGLWGRYSGWGFDLGARYAFVKSAKLQFVATFIADIRLNFNPLFFEARPQLAFGKIIGPVQILLTAGAAIESRANAGVALIGGLHVSARLAPPVALFVETDVYVRNVGRDAGPFTFDVISVGLRLFPRFRNRPDADPLEINAAGHVPYATKYLQPYFGAVQVQGTYYLGK